MMRMISVLISSFIGMTLAATCPQLILPNGTVTYVQSNLATLYSDGTVAYGLCDLGFALYGTSSTMCENGKWKWDFGKCKAFSLEPEVRTRCNIMVVTNGNITYDRNIPFNETDVPEGTSGRISCLYGFEVLGNANFTCSKGMWTPMIGSCNLKICTPPVAPPRPCAAMTARTDATLTYSKSMDAGRYPEGTLVSMKCHSGNPEGAAAASCFEGNWFPPMLGTCSSTVANATGKCGVEVANNGYISYSDINILNFEKETGTIGNLACHAGLKPDGPTSTYCHNGKWTPPLGMCVGQCP